MCDDSLQKYVDLIKNALGNIDTKYFKMDIFGSSKKIIRERVFCYELYHQIRLCQKKSGLNQLTLNAEPDKSGRYDFDRENPDFIFHIPGTMDHNDIIIEVKGDLSRIGAIEKDIHTLTNFVRNYEYRKGIYIIYGKCPERVKERIRGIIQILDNDNKEKLKSIASKIDIFIIDRAQAPVQVQNIQKLIE